VCGEAFELGPIFMGIDTGFKEATSVTILRNRTTPEGEEYWVSCEASAAEVATWPAWKRAGINVRQVRE
jgi:hypothetical protein